MIKKIDNTFVLNTISTTYMFRVTESGHLEHLYYGPSLGDIDTNDVEAMSEKRSFELGTSIVLDKENPTVMLSDLCLEMSGKGKGDNREPLIDLVFADGSSTADFRFEGAEISGEVLHGRGGMPTAYYDSADPTDPGTSGGSGMTESGDTPSSLVVHLRERNEPVTLDLIYDVFPECDVICRRTWIRNDGDDEITIERILSTQLDIPSDDFTVRGFYGAWVREMNPVDTALRAGKHIISSNLGVSSANANPFCILYKSGTTEEHGLCYGLNLIYSGNHYEAAEVSPYGKTRFVSGINPDTFRWALNPGEYFETPQAVMTVTAGGFTALSHAMHMFVREHIVRGKWKHSERPVLVNTWEACYFDIDEKKILKIASKAKQAGMELLVVDDGWFGNRNDDKSSLGDWTVNKKKLPGGLSGLSDKLKSQGLDLGIWVEPEMVSVDSELYRAHPDWAVDVPGREHSEGRNQRILDLTNDEVVDYMTEKLSDVFSSADIKYVKWDMNRVFSDVYSRELPPDRQGEVSHRYVMGLYKMMEMLTERFSEILFEGCSSGGNRFDLGILCYFPQIWASDDTDPICRSEIQEGYSYGYPLSVISNHVSGSPNHQTLRETSLETRYNVACYGVLGYELNLADLSDKELKEIKEQVGRYKEWRGIFQFGKFYRGGSSNQPESYSHADIRTWTASSDDGERAAGMILQKLAKPNSQRAVYVAKGLNPDSRYRFYNIPKKQDLLQFGDLINTQSPIHVKQNSLSHRAIAKFMAMDGEKEDHDVSGSVLMNAGITLRPGFSGTGYDGTVRLFQDFASRLYYIEIVSG